jgi:catechol 2,3-dioxygenase-like lactoylglutathione lyase family enzyme
MGVQLTKQAIDLGIVTSGYRYWTMTVSNLSEMVQACTEAGAKVAVKERELRPGVKIAIVEDPDGNWVEFLALG